MTGVEPIATGVAGADAATAGVNLAATGTTTSASAVRPRSRRWRRVFYRSLMGIFVVATAVAVGQQLRGQDWSVLSTVVRGRDPRFFVLMAGLAFLANAAGLLATMVGWRAVLSCVGEQVPAAAAARIFYVGQFAKYMPGKVLGLVLSIQMGRNIGVPTARMASAWLLALLVSLLTGAGVGVLAGPEVFGGSGVWLALAVLPTLVALARPQLVGRAAVTTARLLRRPRPVQVSAPGVRRAILAQLLAWLGGGIQLWLLALAVGAPPARSFLLCIGAFSLAAVAGAAAVFTPDGIGVREVVLLAALSVTLPLPLAGLVALVSRLVVALSELVTSGVGLLVTEALRRRAAGEAPAPVAE